MSENSDIIQRELINQNIEKLTYILEALTLFHSTKYLPEIIKIKSILTKLKNNEYDKIKENISQIMKMLPLCEQINEVKDFLFFKVIFENLTDHEGSVVSIRLIYD